MTHPTPSSLRLLGFVALIALAAPSTSGCLSEAYTVSSNEIERLAQRPPEQRAKRIRVTQRRSLQDAPRPARHRHHGDCGHFNNSSIHIPNIDPGGPIRVSGRRVGKKVTIHHRGSSPRAGRGGRPRAGRGGRPNAGRGGRPNAGRGGRPVAGSPRASGRGSRGARGRSGGRSSGGNSGAIKDGRVLAAVVVIGAAMVTVGLIASESQRFDGWVEVEPDHPIHLTYRDGTTQMMSLSELTLEDARDARHMILVEERKYDMDFLGPAPLNRKGWTWKLEGGLMALAPPNDEATALHYGAWMELGYFPHQNIGIVSFLGLAGGIEDGADVLGVRTGLGLEVMPLHLGRLHLGAYGVAGLTFDGIEGPDQELAFREDNMIGGGALLELELTTLFAISARAGLHVIGPQTDAPVNTFMTTFGLAVY